MPILRSNAHIYLLSDRYGCNAIIILAWCGIYNTRQYGMEVHTTYCPYVPRDTGQLSAFSSSNPRTYEHIVLREPEAQVCLMEWYRWNYVFCSRNMFLYLFCFNSFHFFLLSFLFLFLSCFISVGLR